MKNTYSNGRYLFVSIIAIVVSAFFFWHQFSRDRLKSDKDLLEVSGKLSSYSFLSDAGFKSTTFDYYIMLKNYSNRFQIKADYIPFFRKRKFDSLAYAGEKLTLTIPKQQAGQLNSAKDIYVLSVDNGNFIFLNKTQTLNNENSGFDIEAGFWFLFMGVALFLYKKFTGK